MTEVRREMRRIQRTSDEGSERTSVMGICRCDALMPSLRTIFDATEVAHVVIKSVFSWRLFINILREWSAVVVRTPKELKRSDPSCPKA